MRLKVYIIPLLVFIGLSLISKQSFSSWTTLTLDEGTFFENFSQQSIVFDNTNKPHIFYGGDHLYHSHKDGSTWVTETIDETPGVGSYARVVKDSLGFLHVSYFDSINKALKYATNQSGPWTIETISDINVGGYSFIAVDQSNKPHVCYHYYRTFPLSPTTPPENKIKYSSQVSPGTWLVPQTVSSDSTVCALAVDSSNVVRVVYQEGIGLYYTKINLATITAPSFVANFDNAFNPFLFLLLDSAEKMHIAYNPRVPGVVLNYATDTFGSWQTETVDSASDTGLYMSMAVDTLGTLHMSYYDQDNLDLKYASGSYGAWTIQTAVYDGKVGSNSSLALDNSNIVYLSYYNEDDQTLKFEDLTTTEPDIVATNNGKIGMFPSIVVNPDTNKASIAYKHATYSPSTRGDFIYNLKFATEESGSWVNEFVDDYHTIGQTISLARGNDGEFHIAYSTTLNELYHAYGTSGSWTKELVNTGGVSILQPAIAIDNSNNLYISYLNQTDSRLDYVFGTTGSWTPVIVDDTSILIGYDSSIVVDSSGYVHIAYRDVTNADLKYTDNTAGFWSNVTVDSGFDTGWYPSLVIDQDGNAAILYYAKTFQNLKLATNISGSWQNIIIDFAGNVGIRPSLKLGSNGALYATYYDETNKALKYITNESGSTVIEVLASGTVGEFSSLALDADNKPHIVFYDEGEQALKYISEEPTTLVVPSPTAIPGAVTPLIVPYTPPEGIPPDETAPTDIPPTDMDSGTTIPTSTPSDTSNSQGTPSEPSPEPTSPATSFSSGCSLRLN